MSSSVPSTPVPASPAAEKEATAPKRRPWMYAAVGSCLAILCVGGAIGGILLLARPTSPRTSQSSSNPPPAQQPAPGNVQPPVIPQAPGVGSQVLLQDSFEDSATSAVPLFGPESMEFQVSDGLGVMTAHNPGILAALYDAPSVADFTATLKFLAPEPAAGAGYGMVFRSDDAAGGLAHFYLLLVSPADGNVVLSRLDSTGVAEIARVPYSVGSNGVITMVTRAHGAHLEVEVDGQPLISADDSAALGPGIVGLAMLSPVENDIVLFQSLKVEALAP